MSNQQANVDRFNSMAGDWDTDPQRVQMGQEVGRAIRDALAPSGSENALEFGAGTGLASMLMVPRVKQLTVLDASAGMLDALRVKLAREGCAHVEIIEGSVPESLPDAKYDFIYSAMTLHHVEDVPTLIKVLADHLVPGGRLAFADLDAEDGSFHGDAKGVAHHGFKRDQFAGWLGAAGLTAVTLSTAWTVERAAEDGSRHSYSIFLAVARLP